MSIVTMKHLGLIALRSDREKLIAQLQRTGCVEISEPQVPEEDPALPVLSRPPGDGLAAARERQVRGDLALSLLRQYGEKKKGPQVRPTVSEERFFDEAAYAGAQAMVDRLWEVNRELASLAAERSKLAAQRTVLGPWLELDVPLETSSTPGMAASFGTLPASADTEALMGELAAETDLWDILPAGRDSSFRYLFFACHRSVEEETADILQKYGFSRTSFRGLTGTAAENDRRLEGELEENGRRAEQLRAEVHDMSPAAGDIKLYTDWIAQEVRREEGKTRLMDTGETFFLTGWFPAQEELKVQALLADYVCAWEIREPTQEEYPQVPVKLKNSWFSQPMSMVTEMYSLPAYGSIDPNPLMAPFFILFYGMMMADMGYGIVMMLVSLIVIRKFKPKGPTVRYLFPLLGLCGVSTFIWGAVTGSFFGDLLTQAVAVTTGKEFALPALFSPLDDAVSVLVGSLVLGVTQIFVGMGASAVQKCRRGQVLDMIFTEVTWWIILIGGGLTVAAMMLPDLGVPALPAQAVLIAGGVLLVAGSAYNAVKAGGGPVKVVLMTLKNIGGALYNNVTGYFSDILSYSRLMALMLAGAVVAQVFNQLGVMTGTIFLFLPIAMVGNALNFALNILGCYVHDMRLQCLEFFGRFYEDGGKPFNPMDITTKYVDVTNQ